MAEIKEAIETLIEESYLLGLSEPEIAVDLQRFFRCCVSVIRRTVKDKKAIDQLEAKLKLISTRVGMPQTDDDSVLKTDGTVKTPQELFAEQAARHKRLMVRVLGEYDPKLIGEVERERYRRTPKPPSRSKRRVGSQKMKLLVLRVCYLVLIAFLLILIYVVILDRW